VAGQEEVPLGGGGSTRVVRRSEVVLRERRSWSNTVIRLLEHLHQRGFPFAPRPVGGGFAEDGREMLPFIDGGPAPTCWSTDAIHTVGQILRAAHEAADDFAHSGPWMPWWGRDLPTQQPVIGHCDAAPWNFVTRTGMPVALLDWDSAGPVGREWDVAQTAWLNAQLHDDDVAERQGLPDVGSRGQLLAAFCEGYRVEPSLRERLVDLMVEVAVRTAAQEAIDGGVTPVSAAPVERGQLAGGPAFTGHELLWAVTWRVRSARWMLQHRQVLERHLHSGGL
jgi:Ser/Thr protein kinase RdoA (MazF antagonist)